MELVAAWMQPLFAAWLNIALAAAVGVAVLRTAVTSAVSAERLARIARRLLQYALRRAQVDVDLIVVGIRYCRLCMARPK